MLTYAMRMLRIYAMSMLRMLAYADASHVVILYEGSFSALLRLY